MYMNYHSTHNSYYVGFLDVVHSYFKYMYMLECVVKHPLIFLTSESALYDGSYIDIFFMSLCSI